MSCADFAEIGDDGQTGPAAERTSRLGVTLMSLKLVEARRVPRNITLPQTIEVHEAGGKAERCARTRVRVAPDPAPVSSLLTQRSRLTLSAGVKVSAKVESSVAVPAPRTRVNHECVRVPGGQTWYWHGPGPHASPPPGSTRLAPPWPSRVQHGRAAFERYARHTVRRRTVIDSTIAICLSSHSKSSWVPAQFTGNT